MKQLLTDIAAFIEDGTDIGNRTIEHLDSLGVTAADNGKVNGGLEKFVEFRQQIADTYRDKYGVTKKAAEDVATNFLQDTCGYRLRAPRVVTPKTKTKEQGKWGRAKVKSVYYETKGDKIKIGDVVYVRA